MLRFINLFQDWWNINGYELLLSLTILFIICYAVYRIGKEGSYNSVVYIPTDLSVEKKRRPPQESKGEVECRRVLEKIFGRPFIKARPNFLNNPVTGGNFNLELDCYNEEMRLAVEYSGVQHYKYVPYFHKNKEAFLNQKYRDQMKRDLCAKHGVLLIEVSHEVKTEDIESYLRERLNIN